MHTTSVSSTEQTCKFTHEKVWPFVEITMDQCWQHTPSRSKAWLFLSPSQLPTAQSPQPVLGCGGCRGWVGCSCGGFQPLRPRLSPPVAFLLTSHQQACCCYNNLKLCQRMFFSPESTYVVSTSDKIAPL